VKAADWDARYAEHQMRHDRDGTLWGVEPNRFVARDLAGLPPGRALDLACGEGRNAIWLAERGWQVTAVDFSSVAIDRGRELAEHRGVTVDFVVADLLGWVPEPEHYDLVVLAYLQLPDDERRAVFGRAARAVAAGGHALPIHDVVLLLQRLLRIRCASRVADDAEGTARGRANRRPSAGVACGRADPGTKPGSDCCTQ